MTSTLHQQLSESDSSAAILPADVDDAVDCTESSSCTGSLLIIDHAVVADIELPHNTSDDHRRPDNQPTISLKHIGNNDDRQLTRCCCSSFNRSTSAFGGHRKLAIVDNIIAGLLIGPLTVAFWRGTWTVLDHNLFATSRVTSGWLCLAAGNLGLLAIVLSQDAMERWLRRGSNWRTIDWIVGYHLYTYIMGLLTVCHWRGLWILIDFYTGINGTSVTISFILGQVGMMLLRCTKNALAPPMVVNVDVRPKFFAYSTRFRVEHQHREHFFLDALLTVVIIHQLVVVFWRGMWEGLNIYLIPDNPTVSGFITIVISYIIQAIVCFAEPTGNALYRKHCEHSTTNSESDTSSIDSRQPNADRIWCWVLETCFYFVGNLVSVFHWRGFWVLLDHHVLPTSPTLSGVLTHVVGIVGLSLMLAGNSVTQGDCFVDGDSTPDDGCTMSNNYFRFFIGERRRQRKQQQKPASYHYSSDSRTQASDECQDTDQKPVFDTDCGRKSDESESETSNNNDRCIKISEVDGKGF